MLKVFLVEDESVIRDGLRDNIPWQQYGFQFVGEAADGEMALPLIRKTRPDVLITDIKMPFMDGLSLSRIVSKEFPKTKIVIISGYDDFEYARQAIEVGVDQFLLKPITRLMLKKTLLEMKEKIEQEEDKNDYQIQYQAEMHVYEQFSRRRFMEKVLTGELTVKEIYEEASKLSLEITAPCYNLLLFYLQEKNPDLSGEGMDDFMRKQDEVLHYFLRHPEYLLFRWNASSYGVLIRSETSQIGELTEKGLGHIRDFCIGQEHLEWYVAVGNPVERLSLLPECYRQVNHYFAYRFMMPDLHVLSKITLEDYVNSQDEQNIDSVDPSTMAQEVIRDFLEHGNESEIHDFVESYLQSISRALKSRMFRAYVVLNIRFTMIAYVESLGASKEEYMKKIGDYAQEMNIEPDEVPAYFVNMLQAAFEIREQASSSQNRKLISRAIAYIDENYMHDSLSLNTVAAEAEVSANYLSAVFSQSMKKTFVEYVTEKRMEKAKKLLKSTSLSSGEIAARTGYKDSHYFSFVFKKTQGMSPREYRAARKEQ
ncbi:MAG TPA: response regulator [Candidatus Mediterraneibacter gallistercoris]|uniref:Stage 0 sporulation protein A homolog n=1 Tax=Candidatus Mediterraneibacter gallistercoris TaxID=2838671 RepID=A0A9D2P4F9_9FIRM|nr:response regulator [Candidatus Mediterraneibacter gallistercoris]